MNKGITLLILLVVLSAMGLVLYSHSTAEKPAASGQEDDPRLAAHNGSGADRNAGPSGTGLRPIDPPLSSLGGSSATDGAAAPIRLTPGDDGRGTTAQADRQDQAGRQNAPANATPPPDAGAAPTTQPERTAPAASTGGKPETSASRAETPAATAQTARTEAPVERPAGGSPGLTPWGASGQGNAPSAGASAGTAATTAQTPAARPAADNKPLSLTGKHTLSAISLTSAGNDARLRIEGGDPFPCKTFVLSDPERLVIDLPGSWTGMKAPAVTQNPLVKNVRLGQHTAGPRLVLDLDRKLKNHTVDRSGNTIEIRLQ